MLRIFREQFSARLTGDAADDVPLKVSEWLVRTLFVDGNANKGASVETAFAAAAFAIAALLGPSLLANEPGMTMSLGMTHYMELLAVHQPRNLIVFMAIPVVLAETLAITELAILFLRDATPAWVRTTSRVAGLLAGPVMVAIFLHLLINAVIPLTLATLL